MDLPSTQPEGQRDPRAQQREREHRLRRRYGGQRWYLTAMVLFPFLLFVLMALLVMVDVPWRLWRRGLRGWAMAALLVLICAIVLHSQFAYRFVEYRFAEVVISRDFDYFYCAALWFLLLGGMLMPFRLRLLFGKFKPSALTVH